MTLSIQPDYAFNVSAAGEFQGNLSPDALMTYLSTRLGGLDEQINGIFNRQLAQQKVQSAVNKIHEEVAKLNESAVGVVDMPGHDPKDPGSSEIEININRRIDELGQLDPKLAQTIRDELVKPGQILWVQDGKYLGSEVVGTKSFLDGISKNLESGAQMDMIRLQSLMSSRQTAIQLSTNLVASLGESTKAIVTNIGR